jgi:hypothetical protein
MRRPGIRCDIAFEPIREYKAVRFAPHGFGKIVEDGNAVAAPAAEAADEQDAVRDERRRVSPHDRRDAFDVQNATFHGCSSPCL